MVLLAQAATPASSPTPADWISVGIAAAAFLVAVLFGLSNRRTARRALAIAERQEARRQSRIDLYLNGSIGWRRASRGDRLLGFQLVVSNPTDSPTSVTACDLNVTYAIDSVLTTVMVPLAARSDIGSPTPEAEAVDLPLRLDANDSALGWFIFRLPNELIAGHPIESYTIVVRDVHGLEQRLDATVVMDTAL